MNASKKPNAPVKQQSSAKQMVPVAPEVRGTAPKKRKRLAKAFSRPLDKTLRSGQVVREKFSLPKDEYARLVELKERLSDDGLAVKKSELIRAGLMLLAALEDDDLKGIVAKVSAVASA